jgi:ubiquinone/menaquinone biosynthesis C-methylase UbiE
MSALSSVAPWDMVAEGYSETTMKFVGPFVDAALELVALQSDDNILDVACGPGTLALAAAQRVASVKALDFSENMISMLRKGMADAGVKNIEPYQGDGQNLPYQDDSFDAAYSLFGLMFFPDRAKGYEEIFRTLKTGGRTCISSWAPVEDSPLLQTLFGAMKAIKPDLPDPETNMESLENPDLFRSELRSAGFHDVEVHRVSRRLPVNSAREFWEGMVKGSAPIVMMKSAMPEEAWREKSEIAIECVEKTVAAFPASLSADAWFGIGVK